MITHTKPGFLLRHMRKALSLDGMLPGGYSLPPDYVNLLPTLACTMSCPYCFQRGVVQRDEELSFAEWEQVIDDIRLMGSTVMVMGGELFQYRRAIDFLRRVKAARLPLVLITNALAVPRYANELVDMGLDSLIVSVDGPAAVHNDARGHPRGHEIATEGIRRVLARRGSARCPTVQVFTAISARTQHHLVAHVDEMVRLGVDRIALNYLIYTREADARAQATALRRRFGVEATVTLANIAGDYADVDPDVVRRQLAEIMSGPHRDRVYVDPPRLVRDPAAFFVPGGPPVRTHGCASVFRELWVLPDGNVVGCANIYDVIVGNVRDGGIRAVWNGPRFRTFRQEINDRELLPVCHSCTRQVVADRRLNAGKA